MGLGGELSFPQNCNERASPRETVALPGKVRPLGAPAAPIRIVDISASGCRFTAPGAIARRDEIWIEIGHLEPVRALVIWVSAGLAGCRFYQPLSPGDLRRASQPGAPRTASADAVAPARAGHPLRKRLAE
ncbi:MAG: PilZ domain-containing protein [Allosphingosinicella sp.]|uniref:PilZ domain-containing protein n=1 Tax=Allosphingosinicella sp. TaxID=2823234 RepID=UPI00392AF400